VRDVCNRKCITLSTGCSVGKCRVCLTLRSVAVVRWQGGMMVGQVAIACTHTRSSMTHARCITHAPCSPPRWNLFMRTPARTDARAVRGDWRQQRMHRTYHSVQGHVRCPLACGLCLITAYFLHEAQQFCCTHVFPEWYFRIIPD